MKLKRRRKPRLKLTILKKMVNNKRILKMKKNGDKIGDKQILLEQMLTSILMRIFS
jgi:hypothetical protein